MEWGTVKEEGIFLSVRHSAEESSVMKAERSCRFGRGWVIDTLEWLRKR